jgi:pathogenesis-related protein 1
MNIFFNSKVFIVIVLILISTISFSFKNSQKDFKSKKNSTSTKFSVRKCSPNEIENVVKYHNNLRSPLGISPISYSEDLADFAIEWCQELGRKKGAFEHRPSTGKFARTYGENIYKGSISNTPFDDAMKLWASEKSKFRNNVLNQNNWYSAGHYSQMIWGKTRTVGCAVVEINGNCIVVCNYDPAGNMMGQRTY